MKRYIIALVVVCVAVAAYLFISKKMNTQVQNEAEMNNPNVSAEVGAFGGSWSGKLNAGAVALTLVLNVEQHDGYVVCTMDSPDQGAKGIGAYKEYLLLDSIALKFPQLGATYRAKLINDTLVGTFTQMGMSFPLNMEHGQYTPNRPQNPTEPYPYQTEQVTFFNAEDNATLAGTLTYPVNYSEKRPVPVVVMVSGSGLQNRDEELMGHKPFLVIADYFARNGIATLRYDDRGFGQSVGGNRINDKATTLDYKRDAQAAVQYLKSLSNFAKVGVLGHSEGGSIAFMLGSEGLVDFVISMAGIGVSGDAVLTAQANEIVRLQGQGTQQTILEYRQNVKALNNDWLNWFIDYNPTQHIATTKCPVLAINGTKDCQVICSQNLPAIKSALPQNSKSVVKEYANLNHLFQECQTGLPNEYSTIEQTICPMVLQDMVQWINTVMVECP